MESLTAFAGTSTVKSVVNVLVCLRSTRTDLVLYCVTPSGTTGRNTSIASPAIGDVAVTFILIGPDTSGVIKNESSAPLLAVMLTYFVREASTSETKDPFRKCE